MILEYSYDKANLVLDLFKQAKIATLEISKVDDESNKYVMEYSLVEDYAPPVQQAIREAFSASLNKRMKVLQVLNEFIEYQTLNQLNDFTLKFNAVGVRQCNVTYSSSYATAAKERNLVQDLMECLERYDKIICEMGVSDQEVPHIYRKDGSGKGKKYTPLTIKGLGEALRNSLK